MNETERRLAALEAVVRDLVRNASRDPDDDFASVNIIERAGGPRLPFEIEIAELLLEQDDARELPPVIPRPGAVHALALAGLHLAEDLARFLKQTDAARFRRFADDLAEDSETRLLQTEDDDSPSVRVFRQATRLRLDILASVRDP